MRVFTMLPMRHWREAGPFAAAAEAAGFDAVMTVELGHDVFTPLAFAALATERDRAHPVDRRRLPAQPDGDGVSGLGPARQLERAVCVRARQPGQRPQRAPLRHPVERAGAAAARVCPGAARGLALLGDRRQARLPGRALPADPDDAGFLAGADRTADGAGHDCRGRRGDAAGRRRSVRRGAAASAVLAPLSRRSGTAAHRGGYAAQRAPPGAISMSSAAALS